MKCRTNRKLSNDKDMVETDIEEVEPGAVFEDKKVKSTKLSILPAKLNNQTLHPRHHLVFFGSARRAQEKGER